MEKKTEKTAEEKHEKQELKDEEMDLVVGGAGFGMARCPKCGGILNVGGDRGCTCKRRH